MLQYLTIIAGSWPITIMVVGLATCYVIRRTVKQAMDNSAEVRNLRASQAVVVHRDSAG